MEIQNIEEHLRAYTRKTKELEITKKILEEKKSQFDIENSQIISDITTLTSQIDNIKTNVKEQAESQYKETGEIVEESISKYIKESEYLSTEIQTLTMGKVKRKYKK